MVVSLCGLAALSPSFWRRPAIRREDGGPVFYRGERTGGTTSFRISSSGPWSSTPRTWGPPPRPTTIPDHEGGAPLRKFKLDELPQLINVLTGDMSLVGPRRRSSATRTVTEEEKAVLTVRPGITDWASIWNSDEGALLAGQVDPDRYYDEHIRPEKIRLQLKYVRERSFRTDLAIILETLRVILGR